jgi:hypothetical protein
MRVRDGVLIVLWAAGLAACGSVDNRDWMKVGQRYTKEEFQRDYRECERGEDKAFEGCMRQRGWVPVNPSKADQAPPDRIERGRGRY